MVVVALGPFLHGRITYSEMRHKSDRMIMLCWREDGAREGEREGWRKEGIVKVKCR
jgi:hypothetical protein